MVRHGYSMRSVVYEQWRKELYEAVEAAHSGADDSAGNGGEGGDNALSPFLCIFTPDLLEGESIPADMQPTEEALRNSQIVCDAPMCLFDSLYYTYFEQVGFLPSPQPQLQEESNQL